MVLSWMLLLVLPAAACAGGDAKDQPSIVATTIVDGPRPSLTTPTPSLSGATARPCPVDEDICAWSVRMLALVRANDVNGLVAASEPKLYSCNAQNQGGIGGTRQICRGAPESAMRPGYQDPSGGEGNLEDEAGFRAYARRILTQANQPAAMADTYGPPDARIGSISCERDLSQPRGKCGNDFIWAHITFINSAAMSPDNGIGLPNKRLTFVISAHRDTGGTLRADGIGITPVPPESALSAGEFPSVFGGKPGLITFYPWNP